MDWRFVFESAEKEFFVRMMRAVAAFHQVEVLTFCVRSNHFHVLLRVPRRPEGFDLSLEDGKRHSERLLTCHGLMLFPQLFRYRLSNTHRAEGALAGFPRMMAA